MRPGSAFLYARFVDALPPEFDHARLTLQASETLDRDSVIRQVHSLYHHLQLKKSSGRTSRPAEEAFPTSENGGRNGTRRGGHCHAGVNRRGRGQGHGNNCSATRGAESTAEGCGNADGGGYRRNPRNGEARRCWNCGRTGHSSNNCTVESCDIIRCSNCDGFGHEASVCAST